VQDARQRWWSCSGVGSAKLRRAAVLLLLAVLLLGSLFSFSWPSPFSALFWRQRLKGRKIPQARVPVAAKAGFIGGAARVGGSRRARTPRSGTDGTGSAWATWSASRRCWAGWNAAQAVRV